LREKGEIGVTSPHPQGICGLWGKFTATSISPYKEIEVGGENYKCIHWSFWCNRQFLIHSFSDSSFPNQNYHSLCVKVKVPSIHHSYSKYSIRRLEAKMWIFPFSLHSVPSLFPIGQFALQLALYLPSFLHWMGLIARRKEATSKWSFGAIVLF
jgi:hypothetical protein